MNLTATEAAARLHCSRKTIYRLIREGRLVNGPQFGRETIVTLASVEALEKPTARPITAKRERPKLLERVESNDAQAELKAIYSRISAGGSGR